MSLYNIIQVFLSDFLFFILPGSSLQAIPIANQVLPTNVTSNPSRIRYYVREYDGQGTEDEGTRIRSANTIFATVVV